MLELHPQVLMLTPQVLMLLPQVLMLHLRVLMLISQVLVLISQNGGDSGIRRIVLRLAFQDRREELTQQLLCQDNNATEKLPV
jgi:hypothetical protein